MVEDDNILRLETYTLRPGSKGKCKESDEVNEDEDDELGRGVVL